VVGHILASYATCRVREYRWAIRSSITFSITYRRPHELQLQDVAYATLFSLKETFSRVACIHNQDLVNSMDHIHQDNGVRPVCRANKETENFRKVLSETDPIIARGLQNLGLMINQL
jgi:hypothetical protein